MTVSTIIIPASKTMPFGLLFMIGWVFSVTVAFFVFIAAMIIKGTAIKS